MNSTLAIRGIRPVPAIEWLSNPGVWFLIWLSFFWIQTHQIFAFLRPLKIEIPLILLVLTFTAKDLWILRRKSIGPAHMVLFLLCLWAMLAPLAASLSMGHLLFDMERKEYINLAKIYFMVSLLPVVFQTRRDQRLLLDGQLLILLILALHIFYRMYVLGEVRDFRPVLTVTQTKDANYIATAFGAFLPLALMRARMAAPGTGRRLWGAVFLLFAGLILFTRSRMGLLAAGSGLLVYAMGCRWQTGRLTLLVGSVSILTILIGVLNLASDGTLLARFGNFSDGSNASRLQSILAGLKAFREHPFFGVGIDQSKTYFYDFGYPRVFRSWNHVISSHNIYVKILAEYGLFGFTAFLALVGWMLRRVALNLHRRYEPALAGLCGMGVLLLNGTTLPLYHNEFYLVSFSILLSLNLHAGTTATAAHHP